MRLTPLAVHTAQARRYSHGVRLAKKNELDGDLVNLALKSTPAVMIDAADYLNEKVRQGLFCLALQHAFKGDSLL